MFKEKMLEITFKHLKKITKLSMSVFLSMKTRYTVPIIKYSGLPIMKSSVHSPPFYKHVDM